MRQRSEHSGTFLNEATRLLILIDALQLAESAQSDTYADVSGIRPEDDQELAIEFEPWETWLGMEIEKPTHERLTSAEIVVHCLWEMTFQGFDQEKIRGEFQALNDTWDELKDSLDADED